MTLMSRKGNAVIGMMDNLLDSLKGMEGSKPKTLCDVSHARGFMVSKFIITPYGVKVVDIQGDCEGVTGYGPEEFIGLDMMKVLKLNPAQIQAMHSEVMASGVCAKKTKFTRKNGSEVDVYSQIVQLSEGVFAETTILANKIMEL